MLFYSSFFAPFHLFSKNGSFSFFYFPFCFDLFVLECCLLNSSEGIRFFFLYSWSIFTSYKMGSFVFPFLLLLCFLYFCMFFFSKDSTLGGGGGIGGVLGVCDMYGGACL